MTTNTEALRAQFEKLLSDSGRACLYEGDGHYAYPHDFSWLCYQAGYAAAFDSLHAMTAITLESIQARQAKLAAMIAATEERGIEVPAGTITLRAGERYAGLVLDDYGQPSHHLVLMSDRPDKRLTWGDAKAWAARCGGSLPTRREQSLLFAHCLDHVEHAWHWSSQEHEDDASDAWKFDFDNGFVFCDPKSHVAWAVAVRRLTI